MQHNACVSSGKCHMYVWIIHSLFSFHITKWCLGARTNGRKYAYSCILHGLIGRFFFFFIKILALIAKDTQCSCTIANFACMPKG